MAIELATAYVSLVPSMRGTSKEISRAMGGAQGAINQAGDGAGRAWAARFGAAVKRASAAGMVAVGAAIGLIITKGLDRSRAIENAQAKLTGLGHSADTVAGIMNNALAAVKGTAYGMGDAASVAAQMVAANVKPGRDLERALRLVGDAATIAGVGMGEMGAIFGKVAAADKIQMDVINQLHDAGIPALVMLSKEIGKSVADTAALASAGEINFATFSAAMEKGLGGAALKSGETTAGAYQNMLAAIGRVGEKLLSGAFPKFKTAFNGITKLLDDISPAAERFGAGIGDVVAALSARLGPAITGTVALLRGDFTPALHQAFRVDEDSPVIDTFLTLRTAVKETVAEVRGGFRAMREAFRAGGSDITSSGLAGAMEAAGLAMRNIRDAAGPMLAELVPQVLGLAQAFSPVGVILRGLTPILPQIGDALGRIAAVIGGALSSLLPVVADALSRVGDALAGALLGALPTLVTLAESTASVLLVITPLLAAVVPAVASLAAGIITLVAPLARSKTLILGLAAAFGVWKTATLALSAYRAVVLGVTAATYGQAGATYAAGNAQKVYAAIMGATAKAQKIAAIATRAWNAAIGANPIVKVIAIVLALGAALVTLYKKNETFRNFVNGAWTKIREVVGATWDWLSKNVFAPIGRAIGAAVGAFAQFRDGVLVVWGAVRDGVGAAWGWLDKHVFAPIVTVVRGVVAVFQVLYDVTIAVWKKIFHGISAVWSWIRDRVFGPIRSALGVLGNAFLAYRDAVLGVWSRIRDGISAVWSWIRDRVFGPIRAALGVVRSAFATARDGIVSAWGGLRSGLSAVWTWVNGHVFGPIRSALGVVRDAFATAVSGISTAWARIKAAAAGPVNFVIGTVYNNGIVKWWNKVNDWLHLDRRLRPAEVKFAAGGVMPGYTPGRDVHQFYSPTGGRLDLSGGEAVMRPEWTRLVGGAGAVAAMNSAARSGRLVGPGAYKDGGIVGWAKGLAGDAWDKIKDVAGGIGDVLTNPAKTVGRVIDRLIGGAVRSPFGQAVTGFARKLGTGIVDTIKGAVAGGATAGRVTPSAGAMGYRAMSAWVRANLPGVRITSGYRPGAMVAGTRTPSMHGAGRALDLAPSMATFNRLLAAFPNATELLYSPAGARQRQRGRGGSFAGNTSGITRANHFSHVHWGMAGGGVVPKLFDDGGWLPQGRTVVENRTGRPEPLGNLDKLGIANAPLDLSDRTLTELAALLDAHARRTGRAEAVGAIRTAQSRRSR